jgi:hypothetical protein
MRTKCSLEYFIEWNIEIYENVKLWFQHIYNEENKRVYVAFDSKALGDSLAWIEYVEEFGIVHNSLFGVYHKFHLSVYPQRASRKSVPSVILLKCSF